MKEILSATETSVNIYYTTRCNIPWIASDVSDIVSAANLRDRRDQSPELVDVYGLYIICICDE
jgi:hypothetical protein